MFTEFFRFDLRYQLRNPILWIAALFFGLSAFAATSSDAVQIGGAIGNVLRNAPYVIVNWLNVFTILGMFVVTVFIAGAVLRDFELGTADMFFATPMTKSGYIFGRFAAGLVASLAIFVVISIAMVLGAHAPWVDPARIGAFQISPFLYAFAVFVIPNLLFVGALLALLACLTRSMLMVYLGVLGFLVLWLVAGALTRELDNAWLASLVDPFGSRALSRATRYWTAAERNTLLPPLSGYLLFNRLLWTGIGAALLAATYWLFKPQTAGTAPGRRPRKAAALAAPAVPTVASSAASTRPRATQRFGAGAVFAQFLEQLKFDSLGVLTGVPFLVMLAFGVLNLWGSLTLSDEMFGTKLLPVTHLMMESVNGSYTFMLFLVLTFYAGELAFKERAARLSEVTDAMPVPDWVPLLAKLATLVAVVVAFMAVGVATAMTFQLTHGFTALEPMLYLEAALIESVPFVLLGALALVLQVLTHNKFLGYLVMIGLFVLQMAFGSMHFDHNLYNYGAAPVSPYSDMNGYGHFLTGRFWFYLYWGLLAAALTALAAAFWVRGTAPAFRARAGDAREKLRGALGAAFAVLLVGFVATGAWIFYNTNIVNTYRASDAQLDLQAKYERDYRKFKDLAQPKITEVKADVDIFPAERRVAIRGHYTLVNPHAAPIDKLHVRLDPDLTLKTFALAGAKLEENDVDQGYRIYALDPPLAAGETRAADFEVAVERRGFTNSGAPDSVNYNGTFFNNAEFFPSFGYEERGQIVDRNERRRRDLGELPRMAKLEDESARTRNYLTDDADWVKFETTISTSADQIALAPGYLTKEWTDQGRRYFHYAMDAPILDFYAFLSGRYEVKRDKWNDVAIEIYYDAKHAYNVDRMIEGTKKSLDYFTKNFGPYQHHQVRILEFPNYARFAQSFANTIPYSESIGFIADLRDPDSIDYVFYVTAHEVAHQWWAHQVIGGNMQGSTMLSESLAQYSALMVQEHEYGKAKMRRFLKYELDRYLSSRGGELIEELPLIRVENQPYIHYRKGSLAFYRLRDEIGEEALNRALARFVAEKKFQQPPYTTSAELIAAIRAETPADKQAMVTDLFEALTFYDNRVVEADAVKRADGKYDVTLKLHAEKKHADGVGAETPATMDDAVEIGVFARAAGAKESEEKVLFLEKRVLSAAEPTVTVIVDEEPYDAGIDPYNKLIDRVSVDNRKRVTLK